MPSAVNVQTQAISGASPAQALPDGMTEDNTTIGSKIPEPGTFTTLTYTTLEAQAPTAAGAALTVTSALNGKIVLLNNAAGSVVTLPAATGSGARYRFVVTTTTTSGAHKILAASTSDFLNGNAVGHTSAGATLTFSAAAATAHAIQMPFSGSQPSGGFIGDYFDYIDVAANLWAVSGMYQAGTTATTPFSATNT